jgi:hypothetical protein
MPQKSRATQTRLDLNPLENLSTVTPIMAAQKNAIMGVSLAILPLWSAITAPRYVVDYRWKLPQISTNAVPFNPAAGHVHTPCLVMLDQAVKGLLRRQAFVNVDSGGHVAQAQRQALVKFTTCDANRPLNSLRVGIRGIVREEADSK